MYGEFTSRTFRKVMLTIVSEYLRRRRPPVLVFPNLHRSDSVSTAATRSPAWFSIVSAYFLLNPKNLTSEAVVFTEVV